MRTAGIIGGIGPESTVDYYRLVIARYRERQRDGSYPQVIVNSIDMHKMLGLIAANESAALTGYLAAEVEKLARAGADFGLLASNTPHMVFDEILRRSPIPLISIVEATCQEAKTMGLKNLGLFGTRFTMQGRFYLEVFSREGIRVVAPGPDEQTYIHDKYLGELVNGMILRETRKGLLEIADRLIEREGIEGLILGGTELPLILRDDPRGIPFLDTTRIHVEAVVERLLA